MKHHSLPSLSEAGLKHFKNLVYDVVKSVREHLLSFICSCTCLRDVPF